MNAFTFDGIEIGMSASFDVNITMEMQQTFSMLSGDTNPLHCDAEYAQSQGYENCLVFGMLEASFYSRLVGVYLPGKYCLLQEIDTKFCAPVFIGDKLTISGCVISKHEVFQRIEIKAEIRNQKNIRVSKAILKAGFHEAA